MGRQHKLVLEGGGHGWCCLIGLESFVDQDGNEHEGEMHQRSRLYADDFWDTNECYG